MKKILAMILALVMVLGVASALADIPTNVSQIEGLPERPTEGIPNMKTKLVGTTQYVILDGPVQWMKVIRNWDYSDENMLQFDAEGVASFDTKGQKVQPGFGVWGWQITNTWDYNWTWWTDSAEDEVEGWYSSSKYKGGSYGEHRGETATPVKVAPGYHVSVPYIGTWEDEDGEEHTDIFYKDVDVAAEEFDEEKAKTLKAELVDAPILAWREGDDKEIAALAADCADPENDWWASVWYDEDGRTDMNFNGYYVNGGAYDMGFAYHGGTNNGVQVKYGRDGRLVEESVDVTGVSFLGSEKTPTKATVTWKCWKNDAVHRENGVITWVGHNYVWFISEIKEEYDDGSSLTCGFAMNGKLIHIDAK